MQIWNKDCDFLEIAVSSIDEHVVFIFSSYQNRNSKQYREKKQHPCNVHVQALEDTILASGGVGLLCGRWVFGALGPVVRQELNTQRSIGVGNQLGRLSKCDDRKFAERRDVHHHVVTEGLQRLREVRDEGAADGGHV